MDYEAAKQLLFRYVNVLTTIHRAKDFGCSQFLRNYALSRDEDDGRLVYSGYFKVIDPITKSVILCQTDGNHITNNILILGQHICDIISAPTDSTTGKDHSVSPENIKRLIERDTQLNLASHPYYNRPKELDSLTSEQLKSIQTNIIQWFTKYMIPIELNAETQELIVAESVRIRPPYEHESDYTSPTRVALKRIKHIVDMRPTMNILNPK